MGLLSENEGEVEETFREVHEVGVCLLNPPSSTEELLKLLDKSEILMAKMEQSSSEPTKDALFPIMRALKSPGLIRKSDMDVKMSVLSCISKMIRITAPDAPYNDSVLKEYFHMLVPALASLSEAPSSRSYGKAASVLEIAADVKFCLLMLDLELYKLVTEMFQLFLKTIRSDHPNTVFNHMETVMTMLVDESEYISLELLTSLLACAQRENQNFSAASWKLGQRVLKICAAKLQPYIKKAVHASVISLDDYFQIVTSICKSGHIKEVDHVGSPGKNDVTRISALNDGCPDEIDRAVEGTTIRNGNSPKINDDILLNEKSSKTLKPSPLSKIIRSGDANDIAEVEADSMKAKKPEINTDTALKKRNWKPNTKTLPDEGYSHYWDSSEKKSRSRKSHEKGLGRSYPSRKAALQSTEDQVIELLGCSLKVSEMMGASSFSQNDSVPEENCHRRGDISILSASKVDFLKPQAKEETVESAAVCLEKECDNTSFLEPNEDISIKDAFLVPRKRKRKRKPTTGKEEVSTMADVDKQLIGKKIKVWWPLDKKFYFGIVRSFDHEEKKHTVLYTDGEQETLNLKEERWEVIGDGEQEIELHKPDTSFSSTPPQRRRNRKSGSAEQTKTGPSSKRGRPRSKRVEIDSEPENPSTDQRVNGQNSTTTSFRPTTPETVTVSKVESSQNLNGTVLKSTASEDVAVSKAKSSKNSTSTSSKPDSMVASPRPGSESGRAMVHCSDK